MSGVEGAEREDYDDSEAGVEQASGFRFSASGGKAKASTTKGTKVHEGKPRAGLTGGFASVE
jgi:hypothetical protein